MTRTFHHRDSMPPYKPLTWFEEAACTSADPDAWWPTKGGAASGTVANAKRICRGCPVRTPCLKYALDTGQKDGIWGGLTVRERRKLKREAAKRAKDAA
jgi:WhiB family transcriptional regulator, redox-sensing transcriptional regulator